MSDFLRWPLDAENIDTPADGDLIGAYDIDAPRDVKQGKFQLSVLRSYMLAQLEAGTFIFSNGLRLSDTFSITPQVVSDLVNAGNNLGTVTDGVTDNATAISALQSSVSTLETTVATHTTQIGNLQADVANLQPRVSSVETSVTNLQSAVGSNSVSVSSLSTRVTANEGDIASLQTNVANLSGGGVTLPQDLGTADSPTFAGLTVDGRNVDATLDDLTSKTPVDGVSYTNGGTFTFSRDGASDVVIEVPNATSAQDGLMGSSDKFKLDNIKANAEQNVQADWNETNNSDDSYIQNKPVLATVATSGSYNDLSDRPTLPTPRTNEEIYDQVAAIIQAGANISLAKDDGVNRITITSTGGDGGGGTVGLSVSDEGTTLPTTATSLNFVGNGVVVTGTGSEKTVTITDTNTDTQRSDESIIDLVGSIMRAGEGIDVVFSDANNTVTYSAELASQTNRGVLSYEDVQDVVAAMLVDGSGITTSYNDTTNQLTISSTGGSGLAGINIQDEGVGLSTAATTLNFTGTGVQASGTGAVKTITISDTNTQRSDEEITDLVLGSVVAGDNITVTPNDGANTVTISASGGEIIVQDEGSNLSTPARTINFTGNGVTASGNTDVKTVTITDTNTQRTDEEIRDVVGATLNAGDNISIVVNDETNTITINSSGGGDNEGSVTSVERTVLYNNTQTTVNQSDTVFNLSGSFRDFDLVLAIMKETDNAGETDARQTNTTMIDPNNVITEAQVTDNNDADAFYFPLDSQSNADRGFIRFVDDDSVRVLFSQNAYVQNIIGYNFVRTGLTVQDEGSTLGQGANTLNFVGTGVAVTGDGTSKTITVNQFTADEIGALYEGLSNRNTFTDALLSKLNAITAGAEPNVQANWNETDSNSDAFIQNKPTIPVPRTDDEIDTVINSHLASGTGITLIQSGGRLFIQGRVANQTTRGVSSHEDIQDVVGAMISATGNVSVNYDDSSNSLTITTTGEPNVQADWNQSNSSLDDFIKNKPSIPANTSDLTNNSLVASLQAGTNVTIDNADPRNPIINVTPAGGGVQPFVVRISTPTVAQLTTIAQASESGNTGFWIVADDQPSQDGDPSIMIQAEGTLPLTDADGRAIPTSPTAKNGFRLRSGTLLRVVSGTSLRVLSVPNSGGGGAVDEETVRDIIGATVVSGSGIIVTNNDSTDRVTVAARNASQTSRGIVSFEDIQDQVNNFILTGSNITKTYDDVNNSLTLTATNTQLSTEQVQDIVGNFVSGSGSTSVTYNDSSNQLVISSTDTNTQRSLEEIQDFMNQTIVAGTGITKNYNDADGTLTLSTTGEANVQSNWDEDNTGSPAHILNRPNLATVATSGAYGDLSGRPTIPTFTSQLTNNNGFINGIVVEDEGNALATNATRLNFTGNGVTASGTGNEKTINITSSSRTDEEIRDIIGTALRPGSGVTIDVDDAANTITINSSGGGEGPAVVPVISKTMLYTNPNTFTNQSGQTFDLSESIRNFDLAMIVFSETSSTTETDPTQVNTTMVDPANLLTESDVTNERDANLFYFPLDSPQTADRGFVRFVDNDTMRVFFSQNAYVQRVIGYRFTATGLTVQEEGTAVGTGAGTLNFVGDNVTVTGDADVKTITISGGSDGVVTGASISRNASTGTLNLARTGLDTVSSVIPQATTSLSGFMSASDKTRVDNLEEITRDTIGNTLAQGEGIDITVNDTANTITISAELASDTNRGVVSYEEIRDVSNAQFNTGPGSGLRYIRDDNSNVVQITTDAPTRTNRGAFSLETLEDHLNTFLQAGTGITKTYDDSANTMTIASTQRWLGSSYIVSTSDPDNAQGANGDFWFKIEE